MKPKFMKSNYYTLFKFIKGVVIGIRECQQVYFVLWMTMFSEHTFLITRCPSSCVENVFFENPYKIVKLIRV